MPVSTSIAHFAEEPEHLVPGFHRWVDFRQGHHRRGVQSATRCRPILVGDHELDQSGRVDCSIDDAQLSWLKPATVFESRLVFASARGCRTIRAPRRLIRGCVHAIGTVGAASARALQEHQAFTTTLRCVSSPRNFDRCSAKRALIVRSNDLTNRSSGRTADRYRTGSRVDCAEHLRAQRRHDRGWVRRHMSCSIRALQRIHLSALQAAN
jgi:hypothetical protein